MATDSNNTQFYDRFSRRLARVFEQEQTILIKDVLVIQYQKVEHLSDWLDEYQQADTGGRYGPIRAAVNLDLIENGSLAFLKSIGNNGRISDTDYHYSLVELLDLLKIRYRPCEVKIQWLRAFLKSVADLMDSKKPLEFFDFLFEQVCSVVAQKNEEGHSQLLSHGIQAATIKTRRRSVDSPILEQSLLRILISWVREFSFQEDHLHSSNTLWLPFDQYHFIPVKFSLLPGMLFLLFSAINIIYRYYASRLEFFAPKHRDFALLGALCGLMLLPKWAPWIVSGLLLYLVTTPKERELLYIYQLLLTSLSVLTTVYFSVYYPTWSFLGSWATLLLMIPSRRVTVALILGLIGLSYWYQKTAFLGELLIRLAIDRNIGTLTLLPLLVWLLI